MPPIQALEQDTAIAGRAVVARNFVYVDWDQVDANLPGSLLLLTSIRVEHVQLWATDQVPLQNGPLVAQPSLGALTGFGPIAGRITGLEAVAHDGTTVADWHQARFITFTIVAQANVTVPKTAILAAVANPLLAAAVSLALMAVGANIEVNIGHTVISVPIARDAAGRITEIGNAKRP